MSKDIVVVSIGNELLDGRTINTNLAWLGSRLEEEGYSIARSLTLRDDVKEISKYVSQVVRDGPSVVLVMGGLGPTWDDVTLQGIADAFHIPMELDRKALDMVKSKSRGKLTPERRKMALLPRGAVPLKNNKGTAPGVHLTKSGVEILAVPGVPEEMKDVFEREILRIIRRKLKPEVRAKGEVTIGGIPEADLAPIIDRVRDSFRELYVKSHAKYSKSGTAPVRVFFSCRGGKAASKVREGMRLLVELSCRVGGVVLSTSSRCP